MDNVRRKLVSGFVCLTFLVRADLPQPDNRAAGENPPHPEVCFFSKYLIFNYFISSYWSPIFLSPFFISNLLISNFFLQFFISNFLSPNFLSLIFYLLFLSPIFISIFVISNFVISNFVISIFYLQLFRPLKILIYLGLSRNPEQLLCRWNQVARCCLVSQHFNFTVWSFAIFQL